MVILLIDYERDIQLKIECSNYLNFRDMFDEIILYYPLISIVIHLYVPIIDDDPFYSHMYVSISSDHLSPSYTEMRNMC